MATSFHSNLETLVATEDFVVEAGAGLPDDVEATAILSFAELRLVGGTGVVAGGSTIYGHRTCRCRTFGQ
jgi:hypothetical protein